MFSTTARSSPSRIVSSSFDTQQSRFIKLNNITTEEHTRLPPGMVQTYYEATRRCSFWRTNAHLKLVEVLGGLEKRTRFSRSSRLTAAHFLWVFKCGKCIRLVVWGNKQIKKHTHIFPHNIERESIKCLETKLLLGKWSSSPDQSVCKT